MSCLLNRLRVSWGVDFLDSLSPETGRLNSPELQNHTVDKFVERKIPDMETPGFLSVGLIGIALYLSRIVT